MNAALDYMNSQLIFPILASSEIIRKTARKYNPGIILLIPLPDFYLLTVQSEDSI